MFGLSGSKVLGLGLTLKSWAYILAGALIVALALFGAGYGYGHGSGAAEATEKAAAKAEKLAAEVAGRELAAQRLLNAANAVNRQLEKEHEQRVADLRAEYAAQAAAAHAADARRIADLAAGSQRLRLEVSSCRAPRPGALGAGPGGADGAGSAELAPAVGAALYGIAADGDRAIRKLTGLQAWADSAVKLCNAPKDPR